MRTRMNVYLPPALFSQVCELAIRRRLSRSSIIEAAVASFLSPDGSDRREAAFVRRLDRLTRQVQRPTKAGPVQVHNAPDPTGQICPFSAHIRLVSPRVAADLSDRPRLFRRGIPYGPPPTDSRDLKVDVVDRGIHFIAYTASIVETFEALQHQMNGAVGGDAMVRQKGAPDGKIFVQSTGGINGIALGKNAIKLVAERSKAV